MSRPTDVRMSREEAKQLVTGIGQAMDNILMMVNGGDSAAKILAFDTLSLLQDKRHVVEAELAAAGSEVQS